MHQIKVKPNKETLDILLQWEKKNPFDGPLEMLWIECCMLNWFQRKSNIGYANVNKWPTIVHQ